MMHANTRLRLLRLLLLVKQTFAGCENQNATVLWINPSIRAPVCLSLACTRLRLHVCVTHVNCLCLAFPCLS